LATVKVAVYEEQKRIAVCTLYIFRPIWARFGIVRDPQAFLLSIGDFPENLADKAVNIGRK